MAFTIFRSTDSGAPPISGATGTLITVLDACLVSGYGAQSGVGWTRAFTSGTGGFRVAYRMPSGNRAYLQVCDDTMSPTGITTALGQGAYINGFESLSAFNVGTGSFPITGGVSSTNFVIARKSATGNSSTARPWIIAADSRTIYMFIQTGDTAGVYCGWAFGEYYSFRTNDPSRCFIIGRTVDAAATTNETLDVISAHITSVVNGHFISRSYLGAGVGTAVLVGKHGNSTAGGSTGSTNGTLNGIIPLTNPEDSTIYVSPIWIHDVTTAPIKNMRGRLRGFWHWLHAIATVIDGDTWVGKNNLANKTFLIIKQSGNSGLYVIETSDTLETN